MRNVVHSAIRESIHSVSYVCINRMLNFVNQNKIVETTRGATWTDLCCRCSRPALSDTDNHLTRKNALTQQYPTTQANQVGWTDRRNPWSKQGDCASKTMVEAGSQGLNEVEGYNMEIDPEKSN